MKDWYFGMPPLAKCVNATTCYHTLSDHLVVHATFPADIIFCYLRILILEVVPVLTVVLPSQVAIVSMGTLIIVPVTRSH